MGETDGEIKWKETEDGIKIEVKGKGIKECIKACREGKFSCCGVK